MTVLTRNKKYLNDDLKDLEDSLCIEPVFDLAEIISRPRQKKRNRHAETLHFSQ